MKRLLRVTQFIFLTLLFFGCTIVENVATIHLNGDEVITLEVGSDFTDPGAICTGQNEECTVIVSDSNVDTNTVGTYHIKYQGILSERIVAEKKRTINVVDTTGPSIELNGEESMDVELGDLYEELGASCIDNYDSTCEIEIEGIVNTDEVGNYNVSYRAVDTSGNTSEVIRNVIVDDTKSPIITLVGNTIIDLSLGETYIEQGVECLDSDTPCNVQITGEVKNTVVGIYIIRYEFSDAFGNVGFAERKISIKDETAPVIKLNGSSSVSITVGNSYTEQGATCTDNYDASCSLEITGDVDTATIGEYRLVYKATDSSGNSTETERVVTVKRKSSSSSSGGVSSTASDTTPPTFYNVPENIIVEYGTVVDLLSLGVTANDNRDGDVTSRIIVDVIDTSKLSLGTHTVTFTVSDNRNNTTTSLTEIDVVDTTAPVITMIGGNTELEAGTEYIELGATCTDNEDSSCSVEITGTVDNDTVGVYSIRYNVTDDAGNAAGEVVRTVTVVDTTSPVFDEIDSQEIEVGTPNVDWTSLITNATDNSDSQLSLTEVVDMVAYDVVGTYAVTVRVTDGEGNYSEKTFNVVVKESLLVDINEIWSYRTILIDDDPSDGGIQSIAINENYVLYSDMSDSSNGFVKVLKLDDDSYSRTITPSGFSWAFGWNVVTEGDYILVSAWHDDDIDSDGVVYVYKFSDDTYERVIRPSDRTENDHFGMSSSSMAINGNYIVVGAHEHNEQGAVYVYKLDDEAYERKITASDGNSHYYFGYSVDLDGDVIVVGSPRDFVIGQVEEGAAYVYLLSDETYERKIVTSLNDNAVNPHMYGRAVSITGNDIIIGAQHENFGGAIYFYRVDDLEYERKELEITQSTYYNLAYRVDSKNNDVIVSGELGNINALYDGKIHLFKTDITGYARSIVSPYAYIEGSESFYRFGKFVGFTDDYMITTDRYNNIITLYVISMNPTYEIIVNDESIVSTKVYKDQVEIDISSELVGIENYEIRLTTGSGVETIVPFSMNVKRQVLLEPIGGVNVVDTTAPVITLIGGNTELEAGTEYIELGAICTDNEDSSCSVEITGTVDNDTVGVYTIRYNVTDDAGNAAEEVVRTVTVMDTTAPTFDEIDSQEIEVGTPNVDWTSLITNATDNSDSQLSLTEVVDMVAYDVVGTYAVTVRVTDGEGNYSEKTFNVVVKESLLVDINEIWSYRTILIDDDPSDGGIQSIAINENYVLYSDMSDSSNGFVKVLKLDDDSYSRTITPSGFSWAFGWNVVTEGDYILVSAWHDDDIDSDGVVYVYKFSDDTYERVIRPSDRTENDHFGMSSSSMAINGNYIVVGAHEHNEQGAVYVYKLDDEAYERKITASDGNSHYYFGYSVDLDGDVIVVGSPRDFVIGQVEEGAAYVYLLSDETYERKIVTSLNDNAVNPHMYGRAVSITGNDIIIGAQHENFGGAIYFYRVDDLEYERKELEITQSTYYNLAYRVDSKNNDVIVSGELGNINALYDGKIHLFKTDITGYARSIVSPYAYIEGSESFYRFGKFVGFTDDYMITTDRYNNIITLYVISMNPTYEIIVNDESIVSTKVYKDQVEIDISSELVGIENYEIRLTTGSGVETIVPFSMNVKRQVLLEPIGGVNVVDTTAPVITLIGGNTELEAGTEYIELGAICTDNEDSSCSVEITGTVDNDTVGVYTIRYNVTDDAGNAAEEVVRTVTVMDTTAPTFDEIDSQEIEVGTPNVDWTSLITNATDNSDSVLVKIESDGVTYTTVGTYSVTVKVTDGEGNYSEEVFNVNVVDTTKPVITITGTDVTIEAGTTFTDLGATCTDNYDNDCSVIVTGVVNIDTVGTYYICYNVTDSNGNAATEVVRIVTVVDTTPPVITLIGEASVNLEVGSVYTDFGATCTDNVDVSCTVVTTSNVDTNTPGTYLVRYNVTDVAGNAATEVVRTVQLQDTTAPVIAMVVDDTGDFDERKVTASDGAYYDYFGSSVLISGNYIVVGSRQDDDNGSQSGSVYVYKVDDPTYERKITASDGATGDWFGFSVSVSGNYIVVGARGDNGGSGAVYVYKLDDPTYERKKNYYGAGDEYFGGSVSVSGNYFAVGVRNDDDNGNHSGAVYVYKLDNLTYQRKITASDGAADDQFGMHVSLSGNFIAVGSKQDDDNGSNSGSVYVYKVDDLTYERKITASDGSYGDSFGSVSIEGNYIVVGSYQADSSGLEIGAAYVYKVDDVAYERKITASEPTHDSWFGYSVSVSGNYIVVGAIYDDDNGSSSGSIYMYKLDDVTFERKIIASDGAVGDRFGVSVSVFGNRIVVGSYLDDDIVSMSGSVYIYSINDRNTLEVTDYQSVTLTLLKDGLPYVVPGDKLINEVGIYELTATDLTGLQANYSFDTNTLGPVLIATGSEHSVSQNGIQKIMASDGTLGDSLGYSVSISDNYIVASAKYDDDNGNSSGSVYVFKLDDSTYERKIIASDGTASDYFGGEVSVFGNYVVVGASSDDDNGSYSGSIYVYKLDDLTYERKIIASDGTTYNYFGYSVSIFGNYIVVGAYHDDGNGLDSGSVYVYKVDDLTYERKIIASDGATEDEFGSSVSTTGNYIVVGAVGDDDNGSLSGSVYVYRLDDPTYERKITSSDGATNDVFGYDVSISGNYVVVGAYKDVVDGVESGSIYVYKLDDPTYERKITASDGAESDYFGWSVSVSGDYIAVGSLLDDDNGSMSGAMYVYKLDDITYERKVTASDGVNDDQFGKSVAVSGNKIIVGARTNDNGSNSGSVYVYSSRIYMK
ncbi:DUF5011 domain-containing protein [Mycoplasmatota bacterium zrk1]